MARAAGAEVVRMSDPAARAAAADALAAGQILVIPFNGIFVLVGDADDPAVPEKIAIAKQRPRAKAQRSSARPSSWPSTSRWRDPWRRTPRFRSSRLFSRRCTPSA